jgi:hypothetical protein
MSYWRGSLKGTVHLAPVKSPRLDCRLDAVNRGTESFAARLL